MSLHHESCHRGRRMICLQTNSSHKDSSHNLFSASLIKACLKILLPDIRHMLYYRQLSLPIM
ncbi:hypothetical protein GDO81_010631 [Engystomops pustulosus]|uniref:Uncharacterized protein n=1 Tax=Engystomops pustulosus TaxID=76066 RepID=A0AAV7C1N5_ENGPU|nr:hypothetical protein GDO81_010631 [Engystomops pustulosus]